MVEAKKAEIRKGTLNESELEELHSLLVEQGAFDVD